MKEHILITSQYPALHFYIIPLHTPQPDGSCTCSSRNCEKIGKHPRIRDWRTKASCDPEQIREWWEQWPDANVGIVLDRSGLICLDADDEETFGALQLLLTEYGVETLTARSGRGGHFYFRVDEGETYSGKLLKLEESWNGEILHRNHVVAPPSLHYSGQRYEWVDIDVEPASLPDGLKRKIYTRTLRPSSRNEPTKGRAYYQCIVVEEIEKIREASKGERNDTLNRAAFSIGKAVVTGFINEDEVFSHLLNAAISVGLSWEEASMTIKSGLSSGKAVFLNKPAKPDVVTNTMPFDKKVDLALLGLLEWNNPPRLLSSGEGLVFVADDGDAYRLQKQDSASLKYLLAISSNFLSGREKRNARPTNPPRDVAESILRNHSLQFPKLTGLLTSPTLRPDGSILSTPGYDEVTGFYLACPEMSKQLIQCEIKPREAIQKIQNILSDFPFDSKASRANALAFLFTAVIRPAIQGAAPLFVIDAPVAGSGKTLLAKVASILEGRSGSLIDAPSKDDELMKRIHGQLLSTGGSGVIILDNQPTGQKLRSATLASLLTERTPSLRRLGSSNMQQVENNATVAITGNNIEVHGDLVRRSIPIRLEPKEANPDERTGFKYGNLTCHVEEHRLELVSAILSCSHAWFEANQPEPSCTRIGSFEEWCRIIGGILEFAGVEGFLENRSSFRENADREREQWKSLLRLLRERFTGRTFSSAQVKNYFDTHEPPVSYYLPDELQDMYEEKPSSFTRALGKAFSSVEDRRFSQDGLRIHRDGKSHGKVLWRVVEELATVAE